MLDGGVFWSLFMYFPISVQFRIHINLLNKFIIRYHHYSDMTAARWLNVNPFIVLLGICVFLKKFVELVEASWKCVGK